MSVKFFAPIKNSQQPSTPETVDSGYCLQGLNLLGHAQLIDLFIGSECGGQGRCGKDRVKIAEKDRALFNPPQPIERLHLGDQRIAEGWRLACQCFPSKDGLQIEVEYEGSSNRV